MSVFSLPYVVAGAWAALCAVPFVRGGRRVRPVVRATSLACRVGGAETVGETPAPEASSHRVARAVRVVRARRAVVSSSAFARVLAVPAARRRVARTDRVLARELPVAVDLLSVAVGAGCTPFLAVEAAARWAPPAVATELAAVVRACSIGASFADALHDAASRRPLLGGLAESLLTAERTGAPVGPALGRLAAEERSALRRRAEAHARRVPVRLLFPLVFLVLPAFVLLTVVPGLAAGLRAAVTALPMLFPAEFPVSPSAWEESMFRRVVTRLQSATRSAVTHVVGECGQSTAEYALVILGACALATLLISWATGSHAISRLFDSVIEKVLPG